MAGLSVPSKKIFNHRNICRVDRVHPLCGEESDLDTYQLGTYVLDIVTSCTLHNFMLDSIR